MKHNTTKALRILSIFFVIVCILMSAVGCREVDKNDDDDGGSGKIVKKLNGKTAEEVYDDAIKYISECDKYTLDCTITEDAKYNGQKMKFTLNQCQVYDHGDAYCKSYSDDDVFASLCFEYWGIDDMIYETIPSQDMNIRINMSTQDFLKSQGFDGYSDNLLMDLDSKMFSKTYFEKKVGGKYELNFDINVDEYMDMISKTSLGTMVASLGSDAFKKMTYTVTVDKDGKLNSVEMSSEVESQGVKMTVNSFSEFTPDKADIPELPADADTWIDYTEYFAR